MIELNIKLSEIKLSENWDYNFWEIYLKKGLEIFYKVLKLIRERKHNDKRHNEDV